MMNKQLFILISTIFLIGMVSATPLSEFMSEDATRMTITMTQDSTTNVFSIDTSDLSFDEQNINISLGDDSFSTEISISGLLSGIDLRTDLTNGANYPVFSNVVIKENSAISMLFDFLLPYFNLEFTSSDINEDNSILTNLASEHPSDVSAVGHSYFIKSDNTYTLGYDKGFGSITNEYKQKIKNAISQGVYSMNVKGVLEQVVLPSFSIEDYLPVLEELGYDVEVTDEDLENAFAMVLENSGYTGNVDLSAGRFQDGTYKIPVTIISEEGTIKKNITLVLSGIVNVIEAEATVGGVYNPSDEGIKEVIQAISGLPTGTIINKLQISDVRPNGIGALGHANELKFLVIEVSQQPDSSGAQINFSVEKSKVNDYSKIKLYVWEDSSWKGLDTTYIRDNGAEYEYTAIVPHFSTFLIGERTSSSSGSSSQSYGMGSTTTVSSSKDSSDAVELTPEIKSETPVNKGLFQRILEFLGLTGRTVDGTETKPNLTPFIIILTFMVMLLVVAVLAVKRRNSIVKQKTAEILKDATKESKLKKK
jgi:hypothetical protein